MRGNLIIVTYSVLGWFCGVMIGLMLVKGWNWVSSTYQHGVTLETTIRELREEEYEYVDLFCHGVKICEMTSLDPHHVVILDETFNFAVQFGTKELTHIHNHPGGTATFSLGDLMVYIRMQPGKAIIVTADGAQSLIAEDGWPSKDELDAWFLGQIGVRPSNMHLLDTRKFVSAFNKDLLIPDECYGNIYYMSTELIQMMADEFGLEFIVEEGGNISTRMNPGESWGFVMVH